MAEPYLGEVRLFSFGFAPRGWTPCDGSLLPISSNQALFAILGTTYGGNGVTTFALPDLRGRVPVFYGNGLMIGQSGGEEAHALGVNEIPSHTHSIQASTAVPDTKTATGNVWGDNEVQKVYAATSNVSMGSQALATAGGSKPHNNMQPYAVMNYCIALTGIFPPRS